VRRAEKGVAYLTEIRRPSWYTVVVFRAAYPERGDCTVQSGFCVNCGEPLAANAAFCPNCGKKVEAPNPDQQATQLQAPPPPPAALGPTVRASTPPAGDLSPPSGSAPTVQAPPQSGDAYASQYAAPPPPSAFSQYGGPPPASGPHNQFVPPPVYAPGPPPPATPGGVAPWAQPQKRQGRRNVFVVLIVVVILIAACGGTAYALFHKSSKPGTASSSTPGASATAGATATTAPTSTTGASGATQTLDNINRVGIYAGVMFTVKSAIQAKSVPDDFSNGNPDQDDILKISVSVDFEGYRYGGFIVTGRVKGPDQRPIERGIGHGNPRDAVPEIFGDPLQLPNAAFYFEVPNTVKISDWTLVIGESTEVQVVIPLAGDYDPTFYQEIPHTMGLNQPITYDNGAITGVITKIITAVWNPCGCQAPKGMRFLRVYFHVTNNSPGPVIVGDGDFAQYVLIYPNGDRLRADTRYNGAIGATVNGKESKDVGFDSWVIPADPAPYSMVFMNPDGSVVGTIDFGTV
jgi:hypothetical protein